MKGRQVSLWFTDEQLEQAEHHKKRTGRSRSWCVRDLMMLGDKLASIEDDMERLKETHDKGEAAHG